MRRFLVPLLCALLVAACAVGTVASLGVRPSSASSGQRQVTTPVLSGRRIPGALESLAADSTLASKLDAVVARSQPATCLTVATGGRIIYSHAPDQALLPASNEKLLTAFAALRMLGPKTRLRTTVVGTTAPDATGTIHGDLFLVGGGDPLLTTDAYRATRIEPTLGTRLEQLADQLVAKGIHHIDGRVVGDESRYDTQRAVATWAPNYLAEHQSGPLSALTVNDNWSSYPWKNAPTAPLERSPDPAHTAADLLALLLTQRGVTIGGGTATGRAPAGLPEISHLDSLPLADIVREMLSESDNQTAELLLKELGYRSGGGGSTAAGLAALRQVLSQAGLPLTGTVQVDGSGLDRGNRVTCRFLTHLLDMAGPLSPLSAGLSVAGKYGTLIGRWRKTPVEGRLRAKTGTLDDVSALSGFVSTVPGDLLTFAFITDGGPKTTAQFAAENDLGTDLITYPEGVDPKAIGPQPIS